MLIRKDNTFYNSSHWLEFEFDALIDEDNTFKTVLTFIPSLDPSKVGIITLESGISKEEATKIAEYMSQKLVSHMGYNSAVICLCYYLNQYEAVKKKVK